MAEFADYVPIQQSSISTDVIYPSIPAFENFLGRGWEPVPEEQSRANGRSIIDRWASFQFYVAVAGPITLEIEGMAAPAAFGREQTLDLQINDRRAGVVTLKPGWSTSAVTVPADALQIGWNRAELHAGRVAKIAGTQSQPIDRRTHAPRIRSLLLRTRLDRPVWAARPEIHLTEDADSVRIEMPTDSILDAYVEVGDSARLTGSLEAVGAQGPLRPGTLNAAIDLLDAQGNSRTLVERTFSAGWWRWGSERFTIRLDQWKQSIVRFRLRSWGSANGVIRWHDVGVEAPGPGADPAARLSGQFLAPPRSGRLGRPHVVIVLVDSGRADAFDGSRPDHPTPHIESLTADATRFTQAWSPSGWTGESIPGLATGWYPESTGTDDWGSQIPPTVPTLAELLSNSGYFTFLWSQHGIWKGNESFRRGFERLGHARGDRDLMPGAADLFVAGRPTFAFVHLLPPHIPYTPPKPFRGSLTAGYEAIRAGDRAKTIDQVDEITSTWAGKTPGPDEIAYVRARYDENARYADHLVGRLIDTIRSAGQYDNTMLVFLADHGEAFWEHGRFLHSAHVYEENVHVPFVVKWPARVGDFARIVTDPVSLIDLVPTLVDGLGLPASRAVFQGRTVLPLVFDAVPRADDLFVSRRPLERAAEEVFALRSGRYKVIYNERRDTTELYDLATDRAERVNLAAKEPLRTRGLLQKLLLQRHRNRVALGNVGGKRQESIDGDTLRALRALGYVQ